MNNAAKMQSRKVCVRARRGDGQASRLWNDLFSRSGR